MLHNPLFTTIQPFDVTESKLLTASSSKQQINMLPSNHASHMGKIDHNPRFGVGGMMSCV
jgi:hypothetical protein